jgi:septal ring factor EnvC (AmiA/AmiB activator)
LLPCAADANEPDLRVRLFFVPTPTNEDYDMSKQVQDNIARLDDIIASLTNEIEYATEVRDHYRKRAARARLRRAEDVRYTYVRELPRKSA